MVLHSSLTSLQTKRLAVGKSVSSTSIDEISYSTNVSVLFVVQSVDPSHKILTP